VRTRQGWKGKVEGVRAKRPWDSSSPRRRERIVRVEQMVI